MRKFLTRFSISAVIVLSVIVWGSALYVSGQDLTWAYLTPFSITLFAVVSVLSAFDKVLWRWWGIRTFVPVPDLRGTWGVELQSTYKDAAGQPVETIKGKAIIRQTFSSLSIRIETPSSNSVLKAEQLTVQPDGEIEIYGVYQSDPSIHLRGGVSEIHYGAFRYVVKDHPPTMMEGTYWTDRITKGSIRFIKQS